MSKRLATAEESSSEQAGKHKQKVAKVREDAGKFALKNVVEPKPTNITKEVGNYFLCAGNKQWFFRTAPNIQLPENAPEERKRMLANLKGQLEEWTFLYESYSKGEFFDSYVYPRKFQFINPPEIWRDYLENQDDISDGDCHDDVKSWRESEVEARKIYLQENANYKQIVNEGIDSVLTRIGLLMFQ